MLEETPTPLPLVKTGAVAGNTNSLSSAAGLGWLSVVLGLLLPPVGLVFAVAAIYKAGHSAKKMALVLGIVGLLAVGTGSVFYANIYRDHASSLNRTYTYTSFDNYKMLGVSSDKGAISFTKPVAFQPTPGIRQTNSEASLTQDVKIATYRSSVTASSIDVFVATPAQPVTPVYLKDFNSMLSTSGLKTTKYTSFKSNLVGYIKSLIRPVPTVTVSDPKPFTNTSIKANAWSWDFATSSTYTDGSSRQYQGELIFAIGKNSHYWFSTLSLPQNWRDNTSTWNQIFDSLKIEQ